MELICPNCNLVIEIKDNRKSLIACPKCLEREHKKFIMLENEHHRLTNLGDGFFEKGD